MNGFTLLAGLACILAILEKERAADLLHDGVPIAGLGLDGIRSICSCGSGMKGEGSGRLFFLRMKRLRAAGTIATPLAATSSGAWPTIELSKGSDSSLRLEAALASRLRISAACCAATVAGEWMLVA